MSDGRFEKIRRAQRNIEVGESEMSGSQIVETDRKETNVNGRNAGHRSRPDADALRD